jgi:MoxR-like ATPase
MTPDLHGADALPPPFDILSRQLPPATPCEPDPQDDQTCHHLWSASEVLAITQAWASNRPLLIRGEAGCGKSQLATALQRALGVPLFTEVIHPRFEAMELLYKVDLVRRLAEAQLLGAIGPQALGVDRSSRASAAKIRSFIDQHLPEGRFVEPGVLLKAFRAGVPTDRADQPLWPRAIVLIDEIDKADADLPNALLGVLGERRFNVPGEERPVACASHPPLILITTNEDRELPPAFVRRCAVLNIKPPTDEGAFQDWLCSRARAHPRLAKIDQPDPAHPERGTLLEAAAQQVRADRIAAKDAGYATVGLAEYIDLLHGLCNLSEGSAERAWPWLDRLSAFALVKQKDQDQDQPRGASSWSSVA